MPVRFPSCILLLCLSANASDAADPKPVYQGKPLEFWIEQYNAAKNDAAKLRAGPALAAFGGDAVPTFMEALKSGKEGDQRLAIRFLEQIGPPAKAAVPLLSERLKDKTLRNDALVALSRMGSDAKAAMPSLLELAKDTDFPFPETVGGAIGGIGDESKPAIAEFRKLLNNESPVLRIRAIRVLSGMGATAVEVVPDLIALLDDADEGVRKYAAAALGRFGPTSAPVLVKALESKNSETVKHAMAGLTTLRPMPKEAVAAFIRALKDAKHPARGMAANGLTQSHPLPAEIIPTLIDLLQDQDQAVLHHSIATLSLLGRKAKDAVPALIPLLKSPSPGLRDEAAMALVAIAPWNEKVLEALKDAAAREKNLIDRPNFCRALGQLGTPATALFVDLLKNQDANARIRTLQHLQAIGPDARDAMPRLLELLADKNTGVVAETLVTFATIGPDAKDAVPTLIELLKSKEAGIASRAAWALRAIGPNAKDAVRPLLDTLKADNEIVRIAAAQALGGIGPDAKDALPAIVALAKSKQTDVADRALHVLRELGSAAADAIPALKEIAKTETLTTRIIACHTLWRLNHDADALTQLIGMLADRDDVLFVMAAAAVADIGTPAKAAVPVLLDALKRTTRSFTRAEIYRALAAIGPDAKDALPLLRERILKDDAYSQCECAEALWRVGKDPAAIPKLMEILDSHIFRLTAIRALARIGPDAKDALPILKELTGPTPTGREAAKAVKAIEAK